MLISTNRNLSVAFSDCTHVCNNHRLLIPLHLEHIDELNAKITQLDDEVDRLMMIPFDQAALVKRLEHLGFAVSLDPLAAAILRFIFREVQ